MAEVSKVRRLTNPGKKRRLSALQKLFFGSKRQRAAVKRNGSAQKKVRYSLKHRGGKILSSQQRYLSDKWRERMAKRERNPRRKRRASAKRKRNVSSIITVYPNPGRRKRNSGSMSKLYKRYKSRNKRSGDAAFYEMMRSPAIARKRSDSKKRSHKRYRSNKGKVSMARTRRRKAVRRYKRRPLRNVVYRGKVGSKRARGIGGKGYGGYVYSSNPGRRRRRRHVAHRRSHRRRNPGVLSGGVVTKVAGVLGGLAITKLLCAFLPAQLNSGVMGYLATGVVAVMQGKMVGKVTKNAALGNDLMIGGLAYLAAKVLNDFMPSIGGYTGISGMGLIGGSNFYVPQVNANGSMGSFVLPGTVSAAMMSPAPSNAGVGRLRRTGRLM